MVNCFFVFFKLVDVNAFDDFAILLITICEHVLEINTRKKVNIQPLSASATKKKLNNVL